MRSSDKVRVSIAAAEQQDKALQKFSVNSRDGEQVSVSSKKPLLLTAGTYYVTVISPNAAKGGNASYSLSVDRTSVFFPKGDNSNDTLQAAAGKPPKTVGDTVSGWVGCGDAADYCKLNVDRDGFLSLDLDSTTADAAARRQIKLELVDASGKKIALSAFDGDTWISRQMVGAGTYFLGVSCTNVRKYNTSYGVTVGMLA